MTTESARGKTYTIKTLLSVLGISRNTLRYYEQIGVISPVRDPDSNYRVYTNDDIFSVAQLNMLKNAGFEVADAQVVMEKTEDASEFVGRLSEQNMRQQAWHAAVQDSLETLQAICDDRHRGPMPRLSASRPALFYFDECETGYDNHVPDPAQDVLIRSMPIATFGSIIEGDFFSDCLDLPKWGRIVYACDAPLLPQLSLASRPPVQVGGCPCLEISYAAEADKIPGFDKDGSTRKKLRAFMNECGFEQAGDVYTSHALPIKGVFYTRVHLPIRSVTWRAKRMLAKLERDALA